MNSLLLFLFKSTLSISLLYLAFRLLMRQETFFKLSRLVLLFMVMTAVAIPFINSPQLFRPMASIKLEPIFQSYPIVEESVPTAISSDAIEHSQLSPEVVQPVTISFTNLLLYVYLSGVIVSILMLIYSIGSVLLLFRKAQKVRMEGAFLKIVPDDIPAFSFGHNILISRHDYETNSEPIITHELVHIKLGHFYDLMLMETFKIIFWFNPLVYRVVRDLKEIHEFQADDFTLNTGIDATKYQLLIIQKCVGHQKFALANSFNHCQIKKRITMMNKQKSSKAWRWKVATFLPLLALLLMAFGKTGENVPMKGNVPEKAIETSQPVQGKQSSQSNRLIEIRKDGNYIDNKLCTIEEIVNTGKEWQKASNDWIHLRNDESVPYSRIDEIRLKLRDAKVYHITLSKVNSDEVVYFAGDVTRAAKFSQGKFSNWMNPQIVQLTGGKCDELKYSVMICFITDKNGKVRDARLSKKCDYPEINAAYEKVLAQIPDWTPAMRGNENASVYHDMWCGNAKSVILKK